MAPSADVELGLSVVPRKPTTSAVKRGVPVSIATWPWPGMTTIREFGTAACTLSTAVLKTGAAVPPSEQQRRDVEALDARGSKRPVAVGAQLPRDRVRRGQPRLPGRQRAHELDLLRCSARHLGHEDFRPSAPADSTARSASASGPSAWSRTAASASFPSARRWRAFARARLTATSPTPPGRDACSSPTTRPRPRRGSWPTGGGPPNATCARA